MDALSVWNGYAADAEGYRRLAVYDEMEFINRNLPDDARILFLNTNQGFFCNREYLADSFFEASQIGSWLRRAGGVPELRTMLLERGVTHLLFDDRNWEIDYGTALMPLLRDPRRVELLYRSSDGRMGLFRLR